MIENKSFLTLQEASAWMGKSTQTIRRMIKKGDVSAQRVKTPQGFHYVVRKEDLGLPKEDRMLHKSPIQKLVEAKVLSRQHLEKEEAKPVNEGVDINSDKAMLYKSPIQNVDIAHEEAENSVLTNQVEILISRIGEEVHKKADFEAIDKILETYHKEKMALLVILERLQSELEKERRRPRSIFGYFVDWFKN